MTMMRIFIEFNDGTTDLSICGFDTANSICGELNNHKPEDFIVIGANVCKAGDVRRVVIEDLDKIFETDKRLKELRGSELGEVVKDAATE